MGICPQLLELRFRANQHLRRIKFCYSATIHNNDFIETVEVTDVMLDCDDRSNRELLVYTLLHNASSLLIHTTV